MDTAIMIVLGLAILLGIVVLIALGHRARRHHRANRREQAHEPRQEADVCAVRADRREAEVQEYRTAAPVRRSGVPEVRDRSRHVGSADAAGAEHGGGAGDDPVGHRRYAGRVVRPDEGVNGFDSGR